MTTGASTSFETTANITTVSEADGKNGPQWHLTVQFPWTNVEKRFVDYVYIDKSSIPDEPTRGIHRVEVAFRSLKNKQDGGKHPGTHYWMNNYWMNKIIGPADQMNPQPNISSIWPGKEDEAARNSGQVTDNTGNGYVPDGNPPANGNGGQHNLSASRYTKDELIVRQVAAKGAFDMICAQIYMPESFDELLETFYHKIMGYRQGYEQGEPEVGGLVEEAKKLGAEAFLEKMANEPPPPAPAPEPETHYCEKHKVEYEKYDKDRATPMYAHKWNDNKHWCVEGNDSLLDEKGQPVTEATML